MNRKIGIVLVVVLGWCVVVEAGGAANMSQMKRQREMMMKQKALQEQLKQERISVGAVPSVNVPPEGEVRAELLLRQQEQVAAQKTVEIAGLNDVLLSLRRSGRDWPLIIDPPAKEVVISYFVDEYRKKGVVIRKPPVYYAGMIDEMSAQTPEMLEPPFEKILRVAATLEYDFDNGQDKDALVTQLLGSREAVLKNRARLGLPVK